MSVTTELQQSIKSYDRVTYWKLGPPVRGRSYIVTLVSKYDMFLNKCADQYIVLAWLRVIILVFHIITCSAFSGEKCHVKDVHIKRGFLNITRLY